MKALDNPVELAETARIFRRALARAESSDPVGGVDGPAPVARRRPVAATVPPVTARGARSTVDPTHGARARPVNRLAVDGPGADTSP